MSPAVLFNFMVFLAILLFIAVAASALLWTVAVKRLRHGAEIVPLEERRPVPWNLLDLLLVALAFYLFQLSAHVILGDRFGVQLTDDVRDITAKDMGPTQLLFNAASLATVLFAAALTMLRGGASIRDLGLSPDHMKTDLRLGAIAFAALAAPIYGLQAALVYFFPVQHPLIEMLQRDGEPHLFVIIGISVIAVAPLCEEMFFRVLLQGWLEKLVVAAAPDAFSTRTGCAGGDAIQDGDGATRPSPVANPEQEDNPFSPAQTIRRRSTTDDENRATLRAIPVVASAFAFALLHVGQGPAPIPLFFFALALGYLYQKTHRIWPSLFLHLLLNGVSLALLWANSPAQAAQ